MIRLKQIILTVLLFFYISNIAPAQSKETFITIKGVIVDSSDQAPLGFVTIVAQSSHTKSLVKSLLSQENGHFLIQELPVEQYLLNLTYVGYKPKTYVVTDTTSLLVDIGTIALVPTATMLEEVQVFTNKPLVEQDIEKLSYNVEADPESDILNTLDLLRKIPMLSVDADDNLVLNGSKNFQVLVNGRRSSLFSGNRRDVFRMLPASTIKKIEVVTSPSAKYEAAGVGGVINIITHKKSISGYNGSVNAGATSPEGYNAGGILTAKTGKFGIIGRINNSYANIPNSKSHFYRDDIERQSRLEQKSESSSNNRFQNAGAEVNYELGSYSLITASYSLNQSSGTNNFIQHSAQSDASGQLTEAFQNLNNGKYKGGGHDLSLDYQLSFKEKEQQQLSMSLNFINSDNNNSSYFTLQPLLNYTGRESTTSNDESFREYSLQADYVHPIGKQLMELGAKSIVEENSSDYFYKTRSPETGSFLLDSSQSNIFDYSQTLHAAYASLSLRKGKWVMRSGLRLEAAKLNARFRSSGTQARQEYANLFPNLSLSRMLTGNASVKVSYSQRIERPNLNYLDPYVNLTDPLNISYGNPDLETATSHVLQLEYSTFVKNTSFNASLFHHFTDNAIEQFTTLGDDSVARTTYGNLGYNRNYGLSLTGNTTLFGNLSLNLNSNTQYVKYTTTINGNQQDNEGFTYNVQGSASYRFSKGWRATGNLSYNSANVLLQGKSVGYTWSNLSINKEFLKNNQASISLAIKSPLQKYRRSTNEVNNSTFYQFRESYTVMRQYSLGFSYRIGKLR